MLLDIAITILMIFLIVFLSLRVVRWIVHRLTIEHVLRTGEPVGRGGLV